LTPELELALHLRVRELTQRNAELEAENFNLNRECAELTSEVAQLEQRLADEGEAVEEPQPLDYDEYEDEDRMMWNYIETKEDHS